MNADSQRSVSIIIPTFDRPHALSACLSSLTQQQTGFPFEIIIVDNNPASGITRPVVDAFPQVRYLSETRKGISYARNAGICAAAGEIIAATDDDVIAPANWLATLTAPFANPEIAAVTGDLYPYRLETDAQRLFEAYVGGSRGSTPQIFDAAWMASFRMRMPPLERIGVTANTAFRASIFRDPRIGLLDEVFGAGSPTGAAEDVYQHYKLIRAGYTIYYEPDAWLYHDHRVDMPGLMRQLIAYRRAETAFYVYLLLHHGERRAAAQLLVWLPLWRVKTFMQEAARRLHGDSLIPFTLMLRENVAYLGGLPALTRSIERVRTLGRSPEPPPLLTHRLQTSLVKHPTLHSSPREEVL